MKEFRLYALLISVGAVSASLPASSATMLTAKNGMTLYVFDKDTGGVPTCYDSCAKQWPPYLATGSEKMGEGWGTVKRKTGRCNGPTITDQSISMPTTRKPAMKTATVSAGFGTRKE